MKSRAIAATAAVIAVLGIAGCKSTGTHGSLKAEASSTAVAQGEKSAETYLDKCGPFAPNSSTIKQIEFGRTLLTKAGRKSFGECVGIPRDQRDNFYGAVGDAAKKVNWHSKAERDNFYAVTIPQVAGTYRNKK